MSKILAENTRNHELRFGDFRHFILMTLSYWQQSKIWVPLISVVFDLRWVKNDQ